MVNVAQRKTNKKTTAKRKTNGKRTATKRKSNKISYRLYEYEIATIDNKGAFKTKQGTFQCTCKNKSHVMANVKMSVLKRPKYTSKKIVRVDVYDRGTLAPVGVLTMHKGRDY